MSETKPSLIDKRLRHCAGNDGTRAENVIPTALSDKVERSAGSQQGALTSEQVIEEVKDGNVEHK